MLLYERRSLSNHAGERIRDWIDRQPADTIFALSLATFFLLLLVLTSVVWEIIRKCRSSWRGHHHRPGLSEQWRRLEDGSSVLLADDGRPISRLGPMASLMRQGPATTTGGARSPPHTSNGGAYRPARTGGGEAHEMRADALTMSGTYAPYDPPAAMHGYEIGSPGGPVNRNSMATIRSGWSGETRVASQHTVNSKKQDECEDLLKDSVEPETFAMAAPASWPSVHPPVPAQPSPSPGPSAATNPFSGPTRETSLKDSNPTPPLREAQLPAATPAPSSGTQPSVAPSIGESAFSTPKPIATSGTTSPGKPANAGHGRNGSFSARPLTLGASLPSSPASFGGGAPGSSGSVSSSPPKVELKRTWSIGTWIPQLRGGDTAAGESEQASEERAGLVRAATSG